MLNYTFSWTQTRKKTSRRTFQKKQSCKTVRVKKEAETFVTGMAPERPAEVRGQRSLTQDSLVVHQVEVNHSNRGPDSQQGQDDEPGEEAAGARVRLLAILAG